MKQSLPFVIIALCCFAIGLAALFVAEKPPQGKSECILVAPLSSGNSFPEDKTLALALNEEWELIKDSGFIACPGHPTGPETYYCKGPPIADAPIDHFHKPDMRVGYRELVPILIDEDWNGPQLIGAHRIADLKIPLDRDYFLNAVRKATNATDNDDATKKIIAAYGPHRIWECVSTPEQLQNLLELYPEDVWTEMLHMPIDAWKK